MLAAQDHPALHAWRDAFERAGLPLALHADLRAESAAKLQAIGFDGYAVGGLAVGEGQEMMLEVLDYTMPVMPKFTPLMLVTQRRSLRWLSS